MDRTTADRERYTVKTLNDLLELTFDSIHGYEDAANDASRSPYQSLFRSRAEQRRELATQLQQEIRKLNGTPTESGTVLGAAHRVFMDIRNSMARGDQAVINEVERGEDTFKERFEAALADENLLPSTRQLLAERIEHVRVAHDEVSQLKHSRAGQQRV